MSWDGPVGSTHVNVVTDVTDATATACTEGRSAAASQENAALSVAAHQRVRIGGKVFTRDERRFRVQGVTYGPFAPNAQGEHFPDPVRVNEDFARMREASVNAVRTYHVTPQWFLHLADDWGLAVFLDIPWPKHVCFLDGRAAQEDARRAVREAARRGRGHSCVLAYSICNEISPSVVRWHGAPRVQRFLRELADEVRQVDPEGLITYANYPSTEYLDLSFLDFVTFNVYLHDPETFRRYLFRLQNLVGNQPLLLGELGMDTRRHGELGQAEFLKTHLTETFLMGLAGAFVFSWTDEWHTGGHAIADWAFGVTHADRVPKASFHAIREVFERRTVEQLQKPPRVSVVVCSYNGGRTLEQCLRSLLDLDYPDFEVLVVDDGSTDHTRSIVVRFPSVRVIHQSNLGLSAARNVGLREATGTIIAYTDSDCYVDPNWLAHLVYQLQRTDAAGVGGPNLSPEDGWLAACVAASPGQPMHVLESDQVAEHIPGCNMAFRREALAAINGFDSQYRKAGDDVDVCWRLQQAGYWITFASGAFVWHHRRQDQRTYLRQQAGYGEAEALLRFKHPDRFNGRGDGKWRGVVYGPSLQGLQVDDAIVYRGTFGTGLFQCLYQPAPAHWAMLPSTLEWHLVAALVALTGLLWPTIWLTSVAMLAFSFAVAALQAAQAKLAPQHDGFISRLVIAGLCYAQPLVRSWKRYCTRLFSYSPPIACPALPKGLGRHLPWSGRRTDAFWTEQGYERTELLGLVIAYMNERGWGKTLDSGWEEWDLEVHCHPWTVLQVCTAQEDHGGRKRLIRVRYRMRLSGYTRALAAIAGLTAAVGILFQTWPVALASALCVVACLAIWRRGTHRAAEAVAVFDGFANTLGLLRSSAIAAKAAAPGQQTAPAGGNS
jgi:O-antigen biosynthesis protein